MRSISFLMVLVGSMLGCGDAPVKKSGPQPIGGLNQPCFPNDTCNAGLECLQNRCVSDLNNVINNNENNVTNNSNSNNVTVVNNQTNNASNNLNNSSNNVSNNTTSFCGNQVIEDGEACDSTELGGNSCAGLGFDGGGTLRCASDCQGFDTGDCFRSTCGNGRVDAGEICDGSLLNGNSCTLLGFVGGTLRCNASCDGLDSSGCQRANCGDGMVQAGEDCDGADLQGQNCLNFGFDGGTLRCTNNCTYEISLCTSETFMCEIVEPNGTPCAQNNPSTCACMGCYAACTETFPVPTYSDCVCAVCAGADECGTCNLDGKCDPFLEACTCADCAEHPLCL